MPGAWIVDFIPISMTPSDMSIHHTDHDQVRYLPSWFPGTGFQKIAKGFEKNVITFSDKPYEFVRQRMAQGDLEPSFLSQLLEVSRFERGSDEEVVVKWSAASLYAGGSDTVRE